MILKMLDESGKPIILQEIDDKIEIIQYYYDRITRSWIIQLCNKNGDQIGDARYIANKKDALHEIEELKQEYSISNIIKF